MNVYLIGYRGSGKSSLARRLGERLQWSWRDADELLEAEAGKSIARIFAEQGEGAFRDLESQVIARLAGTDRCVVALGGGAVLRDENCRAIQPGIVVWLRASVDTLAERISQDPTTAERRPNLTSGGGRQEIQRLLDLRTPRYQAVADFAVTTDGKPLENIADEVLDGLASRGIRPADPASLGDRDRLPESCQPPERGPEERGPA
ncbi:MAG: shikimate kinase [Pirellulaceae bacterium]|nr:shikimate kinase [Pirellulaceae bacterium]